MIDDWIRKGFVLLVLIMALAITCFVYQVTYGKDIPSKQMIKLIEENRIYCEAHGGRYDAPFRIRAFDYGGNYCLKEGEGFIPLPN